MGVRNERRQTNAIVGIVNSFVQRRYMIPHQNVIQSEQEKGFGILARPLSHLLRPLSIESIMSVKSIIQTKMREIKMRLIIIFFF